MITQRLILIALLGILATNLAGQIPIYHSIDEKSGIPSEEIFSVCHASDGALWLGTNAGLVRFNGAQFKPYKCSTFSGRAVSNVHSDRSGRIWCSNFNGQVAFTEGDSLVEWTITPKPQWAHLNFNSDHSKLAIVTNLGVLLLDTRSFVCELLPSHVTTYTAPKWIADTLYVQTSAGMEKFYYSALHSHWNSHLIPVRNAKILQCNNSRHLGFVCTDDQQKNRVVIDDEDLVLTMEEKDELAYYSFLKTDSLLYLGTSSGLYVFSNRTQQWQLEHHWFKHSPISSISVSQTQEMILGTLNRGLIVLPEKRIIRWENLGNDLQKLLITSKNELIVASTTALHWLTHDGEVYRSINLPFKTEIELLQEDAYTGEILIIQSGITFVLSKNYLFEKHPFLNNGYKKFIFPGNNIYGCVSSFNTSLQSSTTPNEATWKYTFRNEKVGNTEVHVHELHTGRSNGLYYHEPSHSFYSSSAQGLTHSTPNSNDLMPLPLSGMTLTCLQGTGDYLFFGTVEHGAWRYHIPTKNYEPLPLSSALQRAFVRELKWIGNTLYIISERGTSRYFTSTWTCDGILNLNDGLESNRLSDVVQWNNEVFFICNQQLHSTPSAQTFLGKKPTSPQKIELHTSNGIQLFPPHTELSHHEKSIEIAFESIAFTDYRSWWYAYRLVGMDSSWVHVPPNSNKVNFASLPPGNYSFEIKTVNDDGQESASVTIPFAVHRPLWLNQWVQASFFAAVLAAVVFFFRKQIARIRKRNSMEQELSKLEIAQARLEMDLNESKLASLKAQMNPHFIFNTLNSIQEMIYSNDKLKSSEYLGKFADLMRTILHMSEERSVTIEEELTMLKLYLELEGLRFGTSFQFDIHVEENLGVNYYRIPPMLIQPYVENAIKHGLLHKKSDRKLAIALKLEDQQTLEVSIEDNGVGRQYVEELKKREPQRHKSFASRATSNRLEILNKEYQNKIGVRYLDLMENEQPSGTRVYLRIPLTT